MFSKPIYSRVLTHVGISLAFVLTGLSHSGHAAVPDTINYQGYLTNADGTPVDGAISVTFAAYNVDLGGVPLWNQTQTVTVQQGLFTAALANPVNPFPAGLFEGPVFIGLFVAGEEMLPRRPVTSAGYAFKAANADTLEGSSAADLDQSGDVAALQGELGTVQSDLGSLGSTVTSNDSRITALEGSAGDITAVSAGAGLVGGGVAGNVALAIGTSAVTSNMLAPASVTSADLAANSVTSAAIVDNVVSSQDIADGTISPEDVNTSVAAQFEFGRLKVGGGGFRIESEADIQILDDFNGLRWFTTDGAEETGVITVRNAIMTMTHSGQGNTIFLSNSEGVGFAGALPTAGFAATVPSLRVQNSIDIGYQIVEQSFDVATPVSQCHSHGNLACFTGAGTANCPTGKKVLGGGVSGASARFGAVSVSRPVGTTGWTCSISYDIAGASRICYAICANVE